MTERQAAADGTDLPLRGLRILDVACFIAAPVAATVLGDYGADVIKVEPVIDGDPNRLISVLSPGYPECPVNYPWHLDSRGKCSLAIDLKNVAARALFDLVEDEQAVAAGILVESANPEMPRSIAAPCSIADVKVPPARPGPEHGAHSAEVLREVGIGWAEIAALTAAGALR